MKKYVWKDYDPDIMGFVEEWLDGEAVELTGLDEGWREFYEYWCGEDDFSLGENFFSKVVYEDEVPIAVIAFAIRDGAFNIMEIVVPCDLRGRGYGSGVLAELLENGGAICGTEVEKAEAVIFPDNVASQKAFTKAGFEFARSHPDGDAWYYEYVRE